MELDIVAIAVLVVWGLLGMAQGSVIQGCKLLAMGLILVLGIPMSHKLARLVVASTGMREGVAIVGTFVVINGLFYVALFVTGIIVSRQVAREHRFGGWHRFLGGVFGMVEGLVIIYLVFSVVSFVPGRAVPIGERTLFHARMESKVYQRLFMLESVPKLRLATKLQGVEEVVNLRYELNQLSSRISQLKEGLDAETVKSLPEEPKSSTEVIKTVCDEVPEINEIVTDDEFKAQVKAHIRKGELFTVLDMPRVKAVVDNPRVLERVMRVLERDRTARLNYLRTLKTLRQKKGLPEKVGAR